MMCFKGITLCFLLIIIQNTNGMHPNVGLDEVSNNFINLFKIL